MTKRVLTDTLILFHGQNLQGSTNQVVVELSSDENDDTTFGQNTHTFAEGALLTSVISGAGFFDAEEPDATLFQEVGAADRVVSVVENPIEGSIGYFLQAVLGQYSPIQGGNVGEMLSFQFAAAARDRLIRGTLMDNTTETTSGDGANRQLGAVAAGQGIYSAVHVFAAAGTSPTLDVVVESDDSGAFTTPVTRLTHPQQTGPGSDFQKSLVAITDDFWRLSWTIGGTTPSFSFAGLVGIV